MFPETTRLQTGRFAVSVAQTVTDIDAAQALRARCFGLAPSRDADDLDALCDHILIHDTQSGELVCCFRMLPVRSVRVEASYSARYYDIAPLAAYEGPLLEISRFCVDLSQRDPDILRLAWAAITHFVDTLRVTFLFGCTSFQGTEPAPYLDAFAHLYETARAPAFWAPGRRASEVYHLTQASGQAIDKRRALGQLPPLLRTYLGMGGKVSDHAVIDRDMNTLHVFTGVEIALIPAARQRLLRALLKT